MVLLQKTQSKALSQSRATHQYYTLLKLSASACLLKYANNKLAQDQLPLLL